MKDVIIWACVNLYADVMKNADMVNCAITRNAFQDADLTQDVPIIRLVLMDNAKV